MREIQRCSRCQVKTDNVIVYNRRINSKGIELRYYNCNDCNTKRIKAYYQKNKAKFRTMIYKSIAKHSHKQAARYKLRNAIKSGALTRPSNCEDCGKECKPHGHHEDYTKPLEVNWLCTTCHADRHQEHRTVVNTSTVIYNT